MSLPAAWVDRIFEKLALVYGEVFLRRWDGLDMAKVKAEWAHELRAFASRPEALGFALERLPAEQPPNALQFRQLCAGAPPPPTAGALPQPKGDPQRVAAALARLNAARPEEGERDPKAWAWKLKGREERDARSLTQAQRDMWRAALAPVLFAQSRAQADIEAAAAAVEVAP